MATMTMSLLGMYNFDNTLFDEMVLPDGLDRDLVISSLLVKSGEFELLYPNPDFMKSYISVWSKKWSRTFSEWIRGTQAQWNPIENYDRYEDSSDIYNKEDSGTSSLSTSETSSGTASGSDGFSSSGSNEGLVSAYDATTYQPNAKNITSVGNTTTTSSNTSASMTGSNTSTTGNTTDSTNTHSSHIHGNIGVRDSADVLRSFYDISGWNLYDHIADVFITEMCIPVY